jgi:membrane protease subunit HflK
LNGYHAGVVLSSVNIERITPPAEAADAFRNVASARADAIRIVNQAEGYGNSLIPRARGEGAQMIEQAKAYRESRANRASGEAARFNDIAAEYAKAPKVTATRAYLEAMEQILPQIKKMIVDSHGDLDLTIVGRDARSDTTKGEMAKR